MLKILKSLLDDDASRALPGHERRHLQVAVASLLHEASRVDLREDGVEHAAAQAALGDLFGLEAEAAAAVLAEGREKSRQMTSYFGPVAVVKRDMGQPERVRLIEHLWRIAYADGPLDPYEDHYVRKIGHLLYVTNTDIVLARNHARERK
jgi:uncharacterized tellurite resistance protein B-like protein